MTQAQFAYYYLYACVCLTKTEYFLEGEYSRLVLEKARQRTGLPLNELEDILTEVLDDYVNHSEDDMLLSVKHFCAHYCNTYAEVNSLLQTLEGMMEEDKNIHQYKKMLYLNTMHTSAN